MKRFTCPRLNLMIQNPCARNRPLMCNSQPRDEESRRIAEFYSDYKIQFRHKNFSRVDRIILEISTINYDAPTLHIIYAEIYLFQGNSQKSRFHLSKYISSVKESDPYAFFLSGLWNDFMGYHELAHKQYLLSLKKTNFNDQGLIVKILFCLINIKKRQNFLDTALRYYNRLISSPEGFKLYPCIHVQIIHIYILKSDFKTAMSIIEFVLSYFPFTMVLRLKAYINYSTKRYDDILMYRKESGVDPYIAYLIARIGTEDLSLDIDVPYYFEEALKGVDDSCHVQNSYGNYYFGINKYDLAVEHYTKALSINSEFKPSIDNMNLIKKLNLTSSEYDANSLRDKDAELAPSESDPDVEDTGFMFIWKMLGYISFNFSQKIESMLPPLGQEFFFP